MRAEMLLYHGLDQTGMIEISDVSSTGPWTELRLTSTQCVTDALAEWTALANAAIPAPDWLFYRNGGDIVLSANAAPGWARLSADLQRLLGSTAAVVNAYDPWQSDAVPEALLSTFGFTAGGSIGPVSFAIGTTFPVDVEDATLDEYRGGRAAADHFGRVVEVIVDLIVPPDYWALVEDSPILAGQAAFKVIIDNEAAFDESNLDGALVVYPIEELTRERESDEDPCWIRFRCTTRDPGTEPASTITTESTLWERLTASLPYGYGAYYIDRGEGIPTLFAEVLSDAIAPAGYDIDATLVVDRSARLGCVVDGDSPIAKGFDSELRFLDSPIVRTYFGTRPARVTQLTQALTAAGTTVHVTSTRAFANMTEIYIGPSCLLLDPLGAVSDTAWANVDRGAYGRARSYPIGTPVTDGPSVWQGRRWDRFLAVIGPAGGYVQGADILSMAPMMWSGYIADRPVRDGSEWCMTARDQVRRIADPIGVAASGTAVWSDDDDGLVLVPTSMTMRVVAALYPTSGTILDVFVQPFAAYTPGAYERTSVLRALIITKLTAASTDPQVTGFNWVKTAVTLTINKWDLLVQHTPVGTDTTFRVLTSWVTDPTNLFIASDILTLGDQPSVGTGNTWRPLGFLQWTNVVGIHLGVVLDEGDPADLPPAGMVVLEAAGKVDYARYTALSVDTADPALVHLTLEHRDQILGAELTAILQGERPNVSVRFLWTDSGPIADILRRALTSTGDAIHGTHDTLPKGQGLGLPMLDADSFEDVFGGEFQDLDFQIFTDSGSSLAEIFGGILRLSRRAIVTRRSDDGLTVDVCAVNIGSADSGVPVATIDEDMLVTSQGRKPVRVKSTFEVPQVIAIKCRTGPVDDIPAGEAALTFKDPHLVDWTKLKWDLEVYGLAREDVVAIGRGWALAIFRAGETRQVLECDVPPWFKGQPGDVVAIDLTNVSLWDYALGVPGYSGLARVLGDPMSLTTGVKTVWVACDGVYTAGPMAPSLGIAAVNGPAAAPTSIDVLEAHYDLLVAAKDGNASWSIKCYLPGGEGLDQQLWGVSDITLPGGGVCRLTITSYPSSPAVTLTTDHELTWPQSGSCTDNQDAYLHTDDGTQWGG